MTLRKRYDYIIVGAGVAGSVLAARLGETPGVRVLVLEAGPSDLSLYVRMPAALSYLVTNSRRIWDYDTGPEPALGGRTLKQLRGRMLGGSGSLNGMVYVRGNRRDYDGWASAGLPEWSYARCLPYFKKLERFDGEPSEYRGTDGPIGVTALKGDMPVFQAFLEAGQQAGYRFNPDYNGYRQEGVHVYQATIDHGVRSSAGREYLRPALGKGNIELLLNVLVHRIRFNGRRAVGVTYAGRDGVHDVEAEREVIICGGAFNSPQLLLLSGVGDPRALGRQGIPVVADVPGVGQNLTDHPVVSLKYRTTRQWASPLLNLSIFRRALIGGQWLLTRSGLGARNFWEVGSFFKSSDDVEYANIQHEFPPVLGEVKDGKVVVSAGFQYQVCLMRPRSRGSVTLLSADPARHPRIVHNYLSAPEDGRDLVNGLRLTEEIVRQKAWDPLRGEAITPDIAGMRDGEVLAWAKLNVGTQYHPASSCRMGVDDAAVVDSEGRVHGTEGLRVVDASIMPTIVSGNLQCCTMMMAEKIADAMKGASLDPIHLSYAG